MSRLSTIFRRRGGDSGSGQETQGQNAPAGGADPAPDSPGFRDRGKLRRRVRYLRRVRDLQLRDLGGLLYETYRQKRPSQELVDRKVNVLAATDSELSGLEVALDDRRPLRELRMPGIGGECPRCGEVYGSAARFCSNCGAGLAGEGAAAVGQYGGRPAAPRPAAAPAAAADAPAGSVLANWSSVGALPAAAPAKGASEAPTPGSEAKPATPGSEAKPTTPGSEAKPATPAQEATPSPGPAAAESPRPAATGPAPEDETVVMRDNDDKPAGGDDASRNGGDERHAKTRAARSPDESE